MKPDQVPKSPIQRIEGHVPLETRDRVRFMLEKTETLRQKMTDKKMDERHLAQALFDENFDHLFIEGFLENGLQFFFREGADPEHVTKVESIIDSFDFERDKDNKLVEEETGLDI